MGCFLSHVWKTVEVIGFVQTQQCKKCPKTRVIVTGEKHKRRN